MCAYATIKVEWRYIYMEISINIYDKKGKEVVRTVKAEEYEIMFGAVGELMKLVKAAGDEDKTAVVKVIGSAWDEVVNVMDGFFPDVTEDEWKCVKVSELVPTIIEIVKYAVSKMLNIPVDSKNA